MNQKWSIADSETQTQSSDLEPKPRTTNKALDVKLDVKHSKNRLKRWIILIAHLKNLAEDLPA